jgi:hypothetical protein
MTAQPVNRRWWCSACDGEPVRSPSVAGCTLAGDAILECSDCGSVYHPDEESETEISLIGDCALCGKTYATSLMPRGVCPECD